MKELNEPDQIELYIRKSGIKEKLSTEGIIFKVFRYEKGELLASPVEPLDHILFPVEGKAVIYGIRNDGTSFPISEIRKGDIIGIIGDVEFTGSDEPVLFVEASKPVVCLAIDIKAYRKILMNDVTFLQTILASFAGKFRKIITIDAMSGNIEERVLNYMENLSPEHELYRISEAIYALRCSRRQLQRVLRKLADEGKIMKTGKGRYKLS